MPDLYKPKSVAPLGPPQPYFIPKGTKLCRIYNHSTIHGVFDWNPTPNGIKRADEFSGGRFDRTPHTPGTQTGYLYAATAETSTHVAVTETLIPQAHWDESDGQHLLPAAVFGNRTLVWFITSRDLALVNLTTLKGRGVFHAPPALTTSRRRDRTRRWGDYIRAHRHGLDGIAYNSSQLGESSADVSFMLFEEECGNSSKSPVTFHEFSRVALHSMAGMGIWVPVVTNAGILPKWK